MSKTFDLEHQFQLYLKRVGLNPATMHKVQYSQNKQAFYGACGQLLIMLRDDMPENENEAVGTMQSMLEQVAKFWIEQKGQNN